MRRTRRTLSAVLALALLLSCIGWTPTHVQAEEATLETNPGTVTENIQAQDSAEGMDILQQEEARGKEHIARLTHEENLNQHIFLNRDGSKTMYLYDHPVKYQDVDGKMQDISLEIAQTQDARYPYRTKANSAVTSFPADMADGIRLEGEGVSIRLAAQMPVGSAAGTTTLVNQRARRVDAETVAYTYDAKTSIEYSLTYTGFKEDIVVNEYTGQTEYNFILYTNGLTLTELGGNYYLTDTEGTIKASIGEIIVFTADERNNTMGEMRAVTVKENQIYGMTIVLDADYLADPDTVYPIRIDPTVQIHYSTAASTAIEDVTIQSGNVSYPEMTTLGIGLRSYGISRVLMRFPGIDFSDYEGVEITEATIVLRDVQCEGTYMPVYCYPFTGSAWTESTASWASLTQSWGAELDCQTISYYNGVNNDPAHYYYFDIADVVQDWVDGTADPDKGILFKASDAVENGTTLESRVFASYERDSYRPIFTMVYNNAVSITPVEAEVYVGETVSLTAVTAPANLAVTWASLNDEIATVNASGVVTGIAPGTAIITAELEDGASASCVVTVLAKSITLNPTSLEMYVGQEKTITATTQPAGEDVDWQTENSAVATVVNGVVTGVSAGSTRIVAELDDGTYTTCEVTVWAKDVILNFLSVEVNKGGTVHLTAETTPIGEPVAWSSANTAVATVSNGVVTGITEGQTEITARVDADTYAVCTVTVIGYFALVNTTSAIDEEQTVTLGTVNVPSHQTVTWRSSNATLATVDSQGEVLGIRAGFVTITAQLTDGTEASCDLYVTIPDGVYRIKSQYAGTRYLGVNDPDSTYSSSLALQFKNMSGIHELGQLWMIKHLAEGSYLVCPMSRASRYLRQNGSIENKKVYTYYMTNDEFESGTVSDPVTIFFDGTGYVIRGFGETSTAFAPTTPDRNAEIHAISYNAAPAQCRWDLELEKGIFVCNENGTGIPRNYKMYLEHQETDTGGYITDTLGYTIVSGTGNLYQTCEWFAYFSNSNPMDRYTGEVEGVKRGSDSYYVSTEIEDVEYRFPFTVICRETIVVKNYYDSTIAGTDLINKIDAAVAFLNDVYNDEFYLYFEMDGIPQYYSQAGIDICPYGAERDCYCPFWPFAEDCGADCSIHHKNVHRIANELYENAWERNCVVVMWSNSPYGTFCYEQDDGTHTALNALGVTTLIEENGEYIHQPIIQMLNINRIENPNLDGIEGYDDVMLMSIVLAHEVAHTLGLDEIYTNDYGDDIQHDEDTSLESFMCIMELLDFDDIAYFYECIKEGALPGLCEYCVSKLADEIADDVYEE